MALANSCPRWAIHCVAPLGALRFYLHPLVGGVHCLEGRLTDPHDLTRFRGVEADLARFKEYENILHKRLEEVGFYLAEL